MSYLNTDIVPTTEPIITQVIKYNMNNSIMIKSNLNKISIAQLEKV